ncbi:LAETG motif-containing sortase-dependent surface protein [Streptomyces gamaensis]|uniref:LAETG motif-containing sortase-dependent surface protein n=1 Tax=Streptomyces gamaensis TaxID=1763542 RepID=A0ABW0YUM3_9ACTN
MISGKRRGSARLLTATLVSGLAVVGTAAAAGPAVADDAPRSAGGVSATLGRITAGSEAVVHDRHRTSTVPAGLSEMRVEGGGSLQTYSVDVLTHAVEGAKYKETGWSESSLHANRNAGRVRWILQHSYPQVNDLAALAKEAGTDTLDANSAAAGTQIAIWRYADSVEVSTRDQAAAKLADHLYRSAQDSEEPEASLTLSPAAVSGKSGGRLGPVSVRTNASRVSLEAVGDAESKGVRIVDKDGNPVTTTGDGGEFYLDVRPGAAPGSIPVRATAATKVPVGRVFVGDQTKTQPQILAGSSESTVTATADATWAEQGAIPALSARKNCERGGVDITADNRGDAPFAFELDGVRHTVPPGRSETTLAKVGEDQAYRFAVTGPEGLPGAFSGILDCATGAGAESAARGGKGAAATTATVVSHVGPAPDRDARRDPRGFAGRRDLAATGGSSTTPTIAGIAIALIVVGSGAVYLLRREKAASWE